RFRIGAATFPGTVKVTQPPGCNLGTYSATVPIETTWLHINSGPSGTPGDAGVSFTAEENTGATARAGIMSIGTQQVTVTQDGLANCAFTMTPTTQNIAVGGADGTFTVKANCPWQAGANVDWITLGTTGTSDVPVTYNVKPNSCVGTRI